MILFDSDNLLHFNFLKKSQNMSNTEFFQKTLSQRGQKNKQIKVHTTSCSFNDTWSNTHLTYKTIQNKTNEHD